MVEASEMVVNTFACRVCNLAADLLWLVIELSVPT